MKAADRRQLLANWEKMETGQVLDRIEPLE
jgi:hypothetical protein